MVSKVTFVGFRWVIAPIPSPLDPLLPVLHERIRFDVLLQ